MATVGVVVDLSVLLSYLREGSEDADVISAIQAFNEQHQATFKFEEDASTREAFCNEALRVLSCNAKEDEKDGASLRRHRKLCASLLACLRLLAREKVGLEPLTTKEGLRCVLERAGVLHAMAKQPATAQAAAGSVEVALEGLKCAYNVTFNNQHLVPLCCELGMLKGLTAMLQQQPSLSQDVCVFAVKLLFLVTSLHPPARSEFRDAHRGLEVLREVVGRTLRTHQPSVQGNTCLPRLAVPLANWELLFFSDVFRILFALTMSWHQNEDSFPQCDRDACLTLAGQCQVLISSVDFRVDAVHEGALQCVYDAALNLPLFCAELYIRKLPSPSPPLPLPHLCYNGFDMTAVDGAVAFLDHRLKQEQPKAAMSVVGTLRNWAKANRNIRRFLKAQILPPLGKVTQRPDEGDSVKSRLIRNMAASLFGMEDLVSDLLFLLCKENSARFIRHVGYGHAAGLLMSRGLLGGGNPPQRGNYSDDSDSETEEYRQCKASLDPVTGGPSKKGPSPLEQMTPEEREREMDKLEQTLDKLNKTGVLKMVGVDKEGRAKVVEPSAQDRPHSDSSDDEN